MKKVYGKHIGAYGIIIRNEKIALIKKGINYKKNNVFYCQTK